MVVSWPLEMFIDPFAPTVGGVTVICPTVPAKFAENCSRSPDRVDDVLAPTGKMKLELNVIIPFVLSVNEPGPLKGVNVPFSGRDAKLTGTHVPVVQSSPKTKGFISDDTSRFIVRDWVCCAFTAIRSICPKTDIHRRWSKSGLNVQVCQKTKSVFVPSGATDGDTEADALATGVK